MKNKDEEIAEKIEKVCSKLVSVTGNKIEKLIAKFEIYLDSKLKSK
ncbi:MAG: hypothetical protein L3I99_01900 [Sulfurimonas sp.]|nr:hypothetical protein [Sulfurimonas sp.]